MSREWFEGEGLFETILVRDGKPYFLDAHLERLVTSARRLALPRIPDAAALAAECSDRAEGFEGRGRMRVLLDRGDTAVTLDAFPGYPAAIYEEGVDVTVAPEPGHPLGKKAGHKALPYSPLLTARRAAREAGAFEVLFRDRDDVLLEGSASNLFLVADGVLLTPRTTRPILPGVTRAETLRAAEAAGIETRETDLLLPSLLAAEEAFLTGSLMQLVPIRRVGHTHLPPGPIAAQVRNTLFPGVSGSDPGGRPPP